MRGDDGINPTPSGSVADVALSLVLSAHGFSKLFDLSFREGFSLSLSEPQPKAEQRVGGLVTSHHSILSVWPRQDEPRVVRLATKCIIAGAE